MTNYNNMKITKVTSEPYDIGKGSSRLIEYFIGTKEQVIQYCKDNNIKPDKNHYDLKFVEINAVGTDMNIMSEEKLNKMGVYIDDEEAPNMNIIKVANKMKKLIINSTIPVIDLEYGKSHLFRMIEKIQNKKVTGEKAHRWIGWIQACVCMGGGANLEDIKNINKECHNENNNN